MIFNRIVAASLIVFSMGLSVAKAEDWKGESDKSELSASAITGMGIVNGSVGFAVLGAFSKKIIKRGFVSDINDSVSIEGLVGPVILTGPTAWLYSAHLRWDFVKDDQWTVFAVGGVGGNIMSVAGSTQFRLTPRFGVGSFYKIQDALYLRADIAQDLVSIGVNFRF